MHVCVCVCVCVCVSVSVCVCVRACVWIWGTRFTTVGFVAALVDGVPLPFGTVVNVFWIDGVPSIARHDHLDKAQGDFKAFGRDTPAYINKVCGPRLCLPNEGSE